MTIQGNRLSVAGAASRLAIIVSLLFGCTGKSGAEGAAEAKAAPGGDGMHVLFIGNSLTYSNDLPLVVQAMAKAAGKSLEVDSVTGGGYSLDDHWNDGGAQKAIASRRWTYVVLQHGPSSLPESRAELRAAVKRFAPVIRKAGAKPALFMVWPPADRISYFDDVRDAYALAAADVSGLFIPAGEAWRAAWRRDPNAPLYSQDDFHPSAAGSYAAALSIYGMIFKTSPQGLPARLTLESGRVVEVPEPLAKLLQDAATEANQKYGKP
jgi:lysophospholipase L1-like esterase